MARTHDKLTILPVALPSVAMTNTRKKTADEIGTAEDPDELLGAVAPIVAAPAQATDSPATKNPKPTKKVKYPCGKCDLEATGNSVCCNSCELWFHFGCVDGMNKDYFDNCKKSFDLMGYSAFLCKIC